jgi:glycosyltransferase involved in cell wall biosynthesis
MKIIIVNYRYFISGGPERYMFNIISLLQEKGHTVIPFSVKHNKNKPSDYEEYFLSTVGSGNEVYGHEYKRNIGTVLKVISRIIYSFEAKRKIKKLINDVKPDLVYVLQFQNKLSCSVIDAVYKQGIPIVQRISDFGHLCPNGIFYHYKRKEICEKCLKGSKFNAIKYKCVNNSYLNSIIKVAALKTHDIKKIRNKIASFVIPAKFTISKFIESGIQCNKIIHIPTFFHLKETHNKIPEYGNFFLYVGRVDQEKGLFTLVKAFENTQHNLIIIGFSTEGYDIMLKNYLKDKNHNITFTGNLDFPQIEPYLETCLCTICPSEWYDNLPNSVLESFAFAKPVIASNLGSIKELVVDYSTGLLFQAGDFLSLRNTLDYALNNKNDLIRMGNNALQKIKNEYSSEEHCNKLLEVFHNTLKNEYEIL